MEYREFACNRIGLGPRCGFEVCAETEAEVMKHAKMHLAETHGLEDTPELEEKIRVSIAIKI